jgi:hypothetical protein
MKNFLLVFALLCIACTTQAQFTTGQKMIGVQLYGGLSGESLSSNPFKSKSSEIGVFLSVSKFKSPTQYNTLGISYRNGHSSIDNIPGYENSSNSNSFFLFAERTKLKQLANRFYFTYTGAISTAYQIGTYKATNASVLSTETNNTYQADLTAGIGLLYQLNERFIFTTNLANILNFTYFYSDAKKTTGTATSTSTSNSGFRLRSGLTGFSTSSLVIGVKYLLKK